LSTVPHAWPQPEQLKTAEEPRANEVQLFTDPPKIVDKEATRC